MSDLMASWDEFNSVIEFLAHCDVFGENMMFFRMSACVSFDEAKTQELIMNISELIEKEVIPCAGMEADRLFKMYVHRLREDEEITSEPLRNH